jgi:hypothetical protein
MISWRLAVLTILGAAVVAGCIAYVIAPALVEADQQLPPTLPKLTDRHDAAISTNIQHPTAEDHITAFERAAEAILKRAQNVKASADEPLFTGRIPLPKKRPIPLRNSR